MSILVQTQTPFGATNVYLPAILKDSKAAPSPTPPSASSSSIQAITTNLGDYPGQKLPKYAKLEITFDVSTVAQNLYWPYDNEPPPGIEPGLGVTVNALFTPDDWKTTYTQPAFLYQDFLYEIKEGQGWIYPTKTLVWKVRFAPHQEGAWQYRLFAEDSGGAIETTPETFTVVSSVNKGFIRVSAKDSRYFEYETGELFLGLGYNLTFGQIDWGNPIANAGRFQTLQENGLQLFRTWLSQWGIFTSAWGAWNSPSPERHSPIVPEPSLSTDYNYPGSDSSMVLTWNANPGMFLGFLKGSPAVKQNTTYHISIRYLIPQPLQGPRIAGQPYGLVAKTGGWLAGSEPWPDNIYGFVDPGTGIIVTEYAFESPQNKSDEMQWSTLEGELTTGNEDYLPLFYLVLENVTDAVNGGGNEAYIDLVEIREDLGNGQFGPNIISKPWMTQHFYFDQRFSYSFDRVLEQAAQYDIYFKLVVTEKNVWDLNVFDYAGNAIDDPRCWDEDMDNNPPNCPAGTHWFYGNGNQMTKVRWLQQTWWRYLQARWGYSPNIHSWELVNEGDPNDEMHYALTDLFAQYMHQFEPNHHLVTTSFWHSFPVERFWGNSAYANVDYADLHHYDPIDDVAENTYYFSMLFGAKQPEGANKPLIRGETGYSDEILQDVAGVWLHNFIWAGVNPGGMYEQYWYAKEHIEQAGKANDLRYHYRPYLNFMDGIPLNNGDYQDAQAIVTNDAIRAWGQKDLVHGCAHLWVQNSFHTWRNVVDQATILPVPSAIMLSGFQPGNSYSLEWWDPYQADRPQQILQTDTITAQDSGVIRIQVDDLTTDIALKVIAASGCH